MTITADTIFRILPIAGLIILGSSQYSMAAICGDAACEAGETCQDDCGTSVCGDSLCSPGETCAEDCGETCGDQICSASDSDQCLDDCAANACGDQRCVAGETCEDDADICEAECVEDLDCDDGNICTGIESCDQGLCVEAIPLDCDDHDACTSDSCDPIQGCSNSQIDGCPAVGGGNGGGGDSDPDDGGVPDDDGIGGEPPVDDGGGNGFNGGLGGGGCSLALGRTAS